MVDSNAISLCAADGTTLAATHYQTSAAPRAQLLVAGATGVPQRFYRRFAEFAAGQGYSVLTLDYRGIGQSAPPSLKGWRMNYLDWGRQDLAAAAQWLADRPGPLLMIGHSYGGHGFGLMPNHGLVERFLTFATGAGWAGYMPFWERQRVRILWHVIGPLIVRYKGFLAWSKLGMGEDLPIDVFHQWRRWCASPRYFFDDPDCAEALRGFAAVRTPIRVITASDDLWAQPASRDAFMRGYTQASVDASTIRPADYALKQIGHMGYFRPESAALWRDALNWLSSTATPSAGSA